ncbi:MAG: mannan endo-1,4-beta-mannosidase, partial [Polyangiaceae bacterium]|nr:mannan endo-1,4-beta-mannosidase [Polyangiaceae bacterium]
MGSWLRAALCLPILVGCAAFDGAEELLEADADAGKTGGAGGGVGDGGWVGGNGGTGAASSGGS